MRPRPPHHHRESGNADLPLASPPVDLQETPVRSSLSWKTLRPLPGPRASARRASSVGRRRRALRPHCTSPSALLSVRVQRFPLSRACAPGLTYRNFYLRSDCRARPQTPASHSQLAGRPWADPASPRRRPRSPRRSLAPARAGRCRRHSAGSVGQELPRGGRDCRGSRHHLW